MIDLLIEAARAAGAEALRILPDAQLVNDKGRGDFATAADLAAQEVALKIIVNGAPGIEIIAEESEAPSSIPKTFFTVDPFDGTIVGSRGAKDWGVLLGYVEDGRTTAGVLFQPERGVLVKAEYGKGCFIQRAAGERFERLDFRQKQTRRSKEIALSLDLNYTATVDHVNRYLIPLTAHRRILVARNLCAAIANTIELLTGVVDAYINPSGGKIWDYAPCALAVEESGGCGYLLSLKDEEIVPFRPDRLAMPIMLCRDAEIATEILGIWKSEPLNANR